MRKHLLLISYFLIHHVVYSCPRHDVRQVPPTRVLLTVSGCAFLVSCGKRAEVVGSTFLSTQLVPAAIPVVPSWCLIVLSLNLVVPSLPQGQSGCAFRVLSHLMVPSSHLVVLSLHTPKRSVAPSLSNPRSSRTFLLPRISLPDANRTGIRSGRACRSR